MNPFTGMNPSSRFWVPLFTALATLLSILIFDNHLFPEILPPDTLTNNPKWFVFFAAVISAILILLFEASLPTLRNFYTLRLIFDRRAKFEGVWLAYYRVAKTTCDDEVLYAGFSIKPTGDRDCPYIVKGDAYFPNGQSFAEWRSMNMQFHSTDNVIDYFYRGRVYTRHDVRGFGSLSFNVSPGYVKFPQDERTAHGSKKSTRDDHTLPHSGTGFFVDDSAESSQRITFGFVRVTNDLLSHIFGNEHFRTFEVERELIRRIHSKYGDIIKNGGYLVVSDGVFKEVERQFCPREETSS